MRWRVDKVLKLIRISVGKKFKAHWQCLYHRSHMYATVKSTVRPNRSSCIL